MLDRDLAALYETETKALDLAVKRNLKRFPPDFMFQRTKEEAEFLRFQMETLEASNSLRFRSETSKTSKTTKALRSQIVTLEETGKGKHSKYLPYAFTEQGVTMLSGVK